MIPLEMIIIVVFGAALTILGCSLLLRKSSAVLFLPVVSSLLWVLFFVTCSVFYRTKGTCTAFNETLLIDALSIFHLFLVTLVFLCSSIYATGYFRHGILDGTITLPYARRFSMLWQTFQMMLTIVLLANNIGLMWVAIEATTLVSAFLIITDANTLSIEAMWKYLLICSVGIVFAFMGTMLTIAASRPMEGTGSVFLFSHLIRHPAMINPKIMLFAFVLIAVGFGTKAGLAPMHTWLPDAHSQAPTPVSAAFSGVMLNCALFCILRYLPITEAALGHTGEARSIVMLFGCISLILAAIFIPIQFDCKRFLAYCSVEHIGIVAIGCALGGFGAFAALLHSANHSIAKMAAFFAAGQIDTTCKTRDMRLLRATITKVPLWGLTFFFSVLILLGVAPGSIFISELYIIKEAFFTGKFLIVGLLLVMTLLIFISTLQKLMRSMFGKREEPAIPHHPPRRLDLIIVIVLLALMVIPAFVLPPSLMSLLTNAAAAIDRGIGL